MKKIVFLFCAVLLVISGCDQAPTKTASTQVNPQPVVQLDTLDEIQDRGVLRVGMEPGYMPFEMVNQKDEVIGFDVDMAKGIAAAMGVKLEIVRTAWDGIIPALLTKKFDMIMSGMTVTQERNLKVNFADPYIVIGQTILIKKELAGEIKSYKDLNNKKYQVASKLGTTGEKATNRMIPNCTYISFETEQEGITDLVNGKVDAFVYDLPYMEIAYSQKGEGKLVYLDQPFTYEPLGWAIRRGNHDFLNWLNNYMTQIKSDGTYDKVYAKWIQSDAWLKQIQE